MTESSAPERREMVVQALIAQHSMSERRACQASGIARSALRYRPIARDDSGVIDEFSRAGLRIEVDTSLLAARVIRALNELIDVRDAPL